MLNLLEAQPLSQLKALDSRAGISRMGGAIPSGDLRRALGPAIAHQRLALVITLAVGAGGALAMVNLAYHMDKSQALFSVTLLAPFALAILPWLLLYVSVVSPRFLGTKDLRASLAESGMAAYFVGPSPFTRRLLVLGRHRLFLVRGGTIQLSLPYEDVSVVGMESRVAGLLLVISIGDSIAPLALPGRVGGPFSVRWSFDGIVGFGRLLRELRQELESRDVPVAMIDLSYR